MRIIVFVSLKKQVGMEPKDSDIFADVWSEEIYFVMQPEIDNPKKLFGKKS